MNTTYIIGAGASTCHSKNVFPNINNIFKIATQKRIVSEDKHRDLIKFIKKYFNLDILNESHNINAEKVYTIIELEIATNPTQGLLLKTQFLSLLVNVFAKLHEEIEQRDQTDGSYFLLQKILKREDTIITFNWDVLLDNVLGRKDHLLDEPRSTQRFSGKSYSQYTTFYDALTGYAQQTTAHGAVSGPIKEGEDAKDVGSNGFYIKLHGSIDWKYCVNNKCRGYGLIFPELDLSSKYKCDECREYVETLIIPPTLNKPIREIPSIRRLWNHAIDAIRKTDCLVVWGYGLPPTDFYSDWLFRQILNSTNFQKLILINPKTKTSDSFIKKFRFLRIRSDPYENFKEYYISVKEASPKKPNKNAKK